MFGLVVGVAAVSEKLRPAADVSGSVTRFLFCHRTATQATIGSQYGARNELD